MQHWLELRTALMLARLGTVSAAAESLGVHRATVNRHIDTLETVLRAKLFQRHARGYTLTENGQEMLDVVGRADEMFSDLAGRHHGRSETLSGNLIVTALPGIASLLTPALREFHLAHPQINIEFAASSNLAKLEYGEAHIAFRAGPKPNMPDYVVKLFKRICFGLYAGRRYVELNGHPAAGALANHNFVGSIELSSRLPFAQWMKTHVSDRNLSLKTTDQQVTISAVRDGIGLGFLSENDVSGDPDFVEILPSAQDWSVAIWQVTHIDLHWTEKVQQFLKHIRYLDSRA